MMKITLKIVSIIDLKNKKSEYYHQKKKIFKIFHDFKGLNILKKQSYFSIKIYINFVLW